MVSEKKSFTFFSIIDHYMSMETLKPSAWAWFNVFFSHHGGIFGTSNTMDCTSTGLCA